MKKFLSAAVCAVVIVSAFVFPASAQLNNFTIVNAGFEDIRTGEGTNWPVKWDGWPSASDKVGGVCTYQVTTAEKHGGKSSLEFKLSSVFNQAAYEYYLKKDNPFNFNGTYTVSCWVKLVNVKCASDGVSMGIQRTGADGNRYDIICAPVTGTTSGWKKLQVEVTKPIVNINQFDFIVKVAQGSGTVYVDDFDIQPYTPSASSRAAAEPNSQEAPAPTAVSSEAPAAVSSAPASSEAETLSSIDEEAGVSSVSQLASSSSAAPAAAGTGTSPVLIVVITVAAVIAIEAVAGSVILLKKKGFFKFRR